VIIGKLIPAGTGFVHGRFQVDTDDLAQRVTMVSNLPTSE
jgi:hypothetical protein